MRKSERPRTPRQVTGKWLALALAVLVQLAFVAVLIFSVRWQNRKPEPVTAELYAPAAKAAVRKRAATAPAPPPPPVPQPAPQPAAATRTRQAPPGRAARAEGREARHARGGHRTEGEGRGRAQEESRGAAPRGGSKKQRAQQEALERQKAEEKKRLDAKQVEARARQQKETEAMRAQAERESESRAKADRDAQARAQQATQRAKAEADWIRSIQAKVRGNVIVPPDMAGNPEAIFEVVQLPTGEIIDVQLRKSSGVAPTTTRCSAPFSSRRRAAARAPRPLPALADAQVPPDGLSRRRAPASSCRNRRQR